MTSSSVHNFYLAFLPRTSRMMNVTHSLSVSSVLDNPF